MPIENFSFKYINGDLCIVYNEGNYQYIKLVLDALEIKEIIKQKEKYGY